LCTKQVVIARACADQFLPYSPSGIALFGMRNVQADSCSNSEQIDTLFISVGGQEGDWGGGGSFWAGGPEFTRACQGFLTPPAQSHVSRPKLWHREPLPVASGAFTCGIGSLYLWHWEPLSVALEAFTCYGIGSLYLWHWEPLPVALGAFICGIGSLYLLWNRESLPVALGAFTYGIGSQRLGL